MKKHIVTENVTMCKGHTTQLQMSDMTGMQHKAQNDIFPHRGWLKIQMHLPNREFHSEAVMSILYNRRLFSLFNML